jgi:hypothetical protein
VPLQPGERAAGPWRVERVSELGRLLRAAIGSPAGRPAIVAVDGRGASGKSTLAGRLRAAVPAAAVVHTDDIAWHEPYFQWAHLLASGVLQPLRTGNAVDFQPPAWRARGRTGSIAVPAGLDLVLVEGTGAGQRELMPFLDAVLWVQSDFAEAERRGIARDIEHGQNGGPEESIAFWHEWMAAELRFFDQDRPWERARFVVAGAAHAEDEVVLADGPLGR